MSPWLGARAEGLGWGWGLVVGAAVCRRRAQSQQARTTVVSMVQHFVVPNQSAAPPARWCAQAGCSASEALLEGLCTARGLRLHKLPRATELVKADAALTCCSILLPDDAQ